MENTSKGDEILGEGVNCLSIKIGEEKIVDIEAHERVISRLIEVAQQIDIYDNNVVVYFDEPIGDVVDIPVGSVIKATAVMEEVSDSYRVTVRNLEDIN